MRANTLWVIEMLEEFAKTEMWRPTVGVALTRDGARAELRDWRTNNPGTPFRIRKYKQSRQT